MDLLEIVTGAGKRFEPVISPSTTRKSPICISIFTPRATLMLPELRTEIVTDVFNGVPTLIGDGSCGRTGRSRVVLTSGPTTDPDVVRRRLAQHPRRGCVHARRSETRAPRSVAVAGATELPEALPGVQGRAPLAAKREAA